MTSDTPALLGGQPVIAEPVRQDWPIVTDSDVEEVSRLLRRGELSYSAREGMVETLEEEFASYHGMRYAIATNSGTSALHSAFFGIGLEPYDEVLAPTNTFLATVMPVFACNAVPVLVDADPLTGNMDPGDIERWITPKSRALVVTHNAGFPADMRPILDVARRHGLAVIEDCSQAHGASYENQLVGTFGDVAAFSLQARKLVPAGEGGMLLTNHQDVFERAVLLGHFRERSHQDVISDTYRPFAETGFGLNYRMHPLGAVLALAGLRRLSKVVATRTENCTYLESQLSNLHSLIPPRIANHTVRPVYYNYCPLYNSNALGGLSVRTFVEALSAEGVPISKPRSRPLHQEAVFQRDCVPFKTFIHGKRRQYRDGDFPGSEHYLRSVVRLPAFSKPMIAELDMIVRAVEKIEGQAEVLRTHENRQINQPC